MLLLNLLTDLGPRMKMFLGKVTIMYTVKALRRGYTPPLILSRLFLLKKLPLKESIDYYDHFKIWQ